MKRLAAVRQVGLARALSKLGYCSRSRAADLVREGRVHLNSLALRDPETPVHLETDRIEVDGAPVSERQKIYLMLNKPRGVVTTASDEKGRRTVYSYLEKISSGLLPWAASTRQARDCYCLPTIQNGRPAWSLRKPISIRLITCG